MSLVSGNGEVFGEGVLNLGMIAGAGFLLLASIWTAAAPSPSAAQRVAQAPSEPVMAAAHPKGVS